MKILFGSLVFVMGAQSMRFLFASMAWYLRDTVGVGVLDLIPIALAPFVLGALLPIASRFLSVRGATWIALWVLVAARVTNQISHDPNIELWASAVATTAFVSLLPMLLSMGRSALVGGVLLGIAIDSAIKGMGLSLDLAFQDHVGAVAAVISIGLASFYLLWACPAMERHGVPPGTGWVLIGIGPFLFFQSLIFQNQGWISEMTGLDGPQSQLVIALLNVVALVAVAMFERNRVVLFASVLAVIAALAIAEGPPVLFTIFFIVAVPGAALVWSALVPDVQERGIGASATYLTIGMTLFVILGLAYYVPLDLSLGFGQAQARLGTVALLAVFMLGAVLGGHVTRPGLAPQTWAFAAVAALLPLFGLITAGGPRLGEAVPTAPLRVMAFNIHTGFDTAGRFSIDDLAQVIADSGATLVGLQEVSRGQLIAGATDQFTLLQQRLGFEYSAFFGTTDPAWGNAIFSRYPIVSVEREYLPMVGTPFRRGYLGAVIEVVGEEILFISTHLQHINDSSVHDQDPEADLYPVHHEQIATILEEWGGRQPAILVGDFNARPDWRQMSELRAAGWLDAWDQAGQGSGYTANAVDPRYRIDYVFHTTDLETVDAGNIISLASDHLSVIADIIRR
jgi:endonuclease/exonuclease/phosphatase family metal-dependent hydrolase